MRKVNQSFILLERTVRWLNKTEGRDKLCKFLQYLCFFLSDLLREHSFYSLQFETLFQELKNARKLFRLFKSIIQYQKLISILLDDHDNALKIFRVLGQVCFFFYWFFDNISIACKIKFFKGDFVKFRIVASIFWFFSLLVSIPTLFIQQKNNPNKEEAKVQLLDSIKYTFDLFPALNDSQMIRSKIILPKKLVAVCGMVSALISTFQVIKYS